MGGKVAAGQLLERFVARECRRRPRARVEERIRELTSAARAAADLPLELGMHQHVREDRSGDGQACAGELRRQLGARERRTATKYAVEHSTALREVTIGKPVAPVLAATRRLHARRAQGEKPPDVRRRDEMPGRPEHVQTQDVSRIERPIHVRIPELRRAKTKRPLRAAVVLRLHRAQRGHHLDGRSPARSHQALALQPRGQDGRNHGAMVPRGHSGGATFG